jgi:hypothetical protein
MNLRALGRIIGKAMGWVNENPHVISDQSLSLRHAQTGLASPNFGSLSAIKYTKCLVWQSV